MQASKSIDDGEQYSCHKPPLIANYNMECTYTFYGSQAVSNPIYVVYMICGPSQVSRSYPEDQS